ncbi:ABC transporter substrate-binding protein [Silvimonas iriomotensis]|nr:ABC transporter substrate-binding protein [Silvimonas iriomotensis]
MRQAMWGLLLGALCVGAPARAQETVDVLHWWTSASERHAADYLADRLQDEGVTWQDAAIPGGAGVGAMKVLKSRVLSGKAPDAAQLIGPAISEWADLGLLLELDNVARRANWSDKLFPTVASVIRMRGHVVAAPLGIHRINTLFYNQAIFTKLGLAAPRSWPEFERTADAISRAGYTPLAQSTESWQIATLFETLLLSETGPAMYRDLLVRRNANAWYDVRVTRALERLRRLKHWMPQNLSERPWQDEAADLARGKAAMWIMGDWGKGELQAMGLTPGDQFGCTAVPGTADAHLYSIDTLVMFTGDYANQSAQEKLAQMVASPAVQAGYNKIKGSVPVRRDVDPSTLDPCARQSWTTFGRGQAVQAPSLVHRMATDEALKDAIVSLIRRYFLDDRIPTSELQRRIAAVIRALSLEGNSYDSQDTGR